MAAVEAEAPAGEIIDVPNLLRAKVGPRFAGIDPVAVARAEAAMRELSGQFSAWMQEEVARLEAARARVRTEGSTPAAMDGLHLCAHDLKGLGGTYGFPLATRVCASLSRLLDDPARRSQVPQSLIDAHVDGVRALVRDDVRDAAHPVGLHLCEALEMRVTEHRTTTGARGAAQGVGGARILRV